MNNKELLNAFRNTDTVMDAIYDSLNAYVKSKGIVKGNRNLQRGNVVSVCIKLILVMIATDSNILTLQNNVLAKHLRCDNKKVATRMADTFKKYDLGIYASTTNYYVRKVQDIQGNSIEPDSIKREGSLYTISINPEIIKLVKSSLDAYEIDIDKLTKDFNDAQSEVLKIKNSKVVTLEIKTYVTEEDITTKIFTIETDKLKNTKSTSRKDIDKDNNEKIIYVNKKSRINSPKQEELKEEDLLLEEEGVFVNPIYNEVLEASRTIKEEDVVVALEETKDVLGLESNDEVMDVFVNRQVTNEDITKLGYTKLNFNSFILSKLSKGIQNKLMDLKTIAKQVEIYNEEKEQEALFQEFLDSQEKTNKRG